MEVWKDIPEYEELYAVSNYARVKSYAKTRVTGRGAIRHFPERILKTGAVCGYLQVALFKNGKGKWYRVHRLVAEAFIPNPYNLPYVCHKDDNKTNNRADNLFWGTNKNNQDDSHNKGRHIKPKRRVIAILPDGSREYEFESINEAARHTGINLGNIGSCCRGKLNTAGGLIWKYD
jgi:hypothetical protein